MNKKYIVFIFTNLGILLSLFGRTQVLPSNDRFTYSNLYSIYDNSLELENYEHENKDSISNQSVIDNSDEQIQKNTTLEDSSQEYSVCSITPKTNVSGLGRPQGVLTIGNKVLVVDGQDALIHVFTVGGDNMERISTFGSYGNGPGQFNNPQFLAMDMEGYIYVSHAGNGKISVLRFNGDQLEFVKFHSQSYVYPTGIAIQGNCLFLSETQTSTLRIFTIAGGNMTEVGTYNNYGSGLGQLNQPFGLRVKDSLLYVADRNNSRVQIFKILGNQLQFFRNIGGNGMGNGQFQFPTDIELVGNEVYVADRGNGRIQVFYFDGQKYPWLENYKQSSTSENAPSGLARIQDRLFVADQETRDLQWLNIPKPADFGIVGKSVYTAMEPIRLELTTTGIGYQVYWYKAPNRIVSSQSVYEVENASTRQNGTYFALLTNGCRTLTTTSINLLVNRLDQTVTGFVLPKDTFLLIDKYYVLNNIRFSGSNSTLYSSSNQSVAFWQFSTSGGDTIRFNSEGETILTVSNNGTIYHNPVQASIRLVVMDLDPSIVRVPQTITSQQFGLVRLKEMEIASLKLGFQASSGLKISYTANSNEGAIFDLVDDSLAIYGWGTITLTGFQRGNKYFLPSPIATSVIKIIPAVLTIDNDEEKAESINLFPNPAPVSSWISIYREEEPVEVRVINLIGEEVLAERNGRNLRFKTSGVFFVHAKYKSGVIQVKKLVVY